MIKIDVMVHCGNAPKMERVINLTLALLIKDVTEAKKHIRDDFIWNDIGSGITVQFKNLKNGLPKIQDVKMIKIDNGLSHGNGAMCEGLLEFENDASLHFCFVAKFVSTARGAAIKELHSYFIST